MAKTDDNLYEIYDLSYSYHLGNNEVVAIQDICLSIPPHTLTTFSGPSGSGKSTLLNILALIEPVQTGTVLFENEDISGIPEREKNEIRKFRIGFIFQEFHLIPVLSAEENVALFLKLQHLPRAEIKDRVDDTLHAVGLYHHRKKRPRELSYGQMQRVAVARAMAKHPDVIIGDEPTASLDQKNGKEIMHIFEDLVSERDISVILTTHDPMVQDYANLKFHIQDGVLVP